MKKLRPRFLRNEYVPGLSPSSYSESSQILIHSSLEVASQKSSSPHSSSPEPLVSELQSYSFLSDESSPKQVYYQLLEKMLSESQDNYHSFFLVDGTKRDELIAFSDTSTVFPPVPEYEKS